MPHSAEGPGLIDSREIYDGRIVHLNLDRVRYPDGSEGEQEIVRHSGASAVVPLLDSLDHADPRVVLVHQYRYAADGDLFEIPAGRPDQEGEDWELCARRELEEETGYAARRFIHLTEILTTPGFTDEKIHLYLAVDLSEGSISRDDDEFIEIVTFPLSEAISMVMSGRITDAKTICGLLMAARYLDHGVSSE